MSTNIKQPRRPQNEAEQKARKAKPRSGKPANGRKSGSSGDDMAPETSQVPNSNKNNGKGKGGAKAKDTSPRDPKKNKPRKDKSSETTPVPQVISGRATLPSGDSAFAGSSFHESPAASSLPQPSFAKTPERAAKPEVATLPPPPPPPPSSANVQNIPPSNMMPMHNGYGHMHYMPMHMPMHSMPMAPMGYPIGAAPGMMATHTMNPHMHMPMHMMPVYHHPGMVNGQYSQPSLQPQHQSSFGPNGAKASQ